VSSAFIISTIITDTEKLFMECTDIPVVMPSQFRQVHIPEGSTVLIRAGHSENNDADQIPLVRGIEKELAKRRVRVLNPVDRNLTAAKKDLCYPIMEKAGVSIPRFLTSPSEPQLLEAVACKHLDYPFIYRHETYLIESPADLSRVHARLCSKPRIAMQFIEDREGPYYARVRAYVVGGEFDMAGRVLGRHWLIQRLDKDEQYRADFRRANDTFQLNDQSKAALLRCGQSLNLSIYAADMLIQNGTGFVIDPNPVYTLSLSLDLFSETKAKHRALHAQRVADYLRGNFHDR